MLTNFRAKLEENWRQHACSQFTCSLVPSCNFRGTKPAKQVLSIVDDFQSRWLISSVVQQSVQKVLFKNFETEGPVGSWEFAPWVCVGSVRWASHYECNSFVKLEVSTVASFSPPSILHANSLHNPFCFVCLFLW